MANEGAYTQSEVMKAQWSVDPIKRSFTTAGFTESTAMTAGRVYEIVAQGSDCEFIQGATGLTPTVGCYLAQGASKVLKASGTALRIYVKGITGSGTLYVQTPEAG